MHIKQFALIIKILIVIENYIRQSKTSKTRSFHCSFSHQQCNNNDTKKMLCQTNDECETKLLPSKKKNGEKKSYKKNVQGIVKQENWLWSGMVGCIFCFIACDECIYFMGATYIHESRNGFFFSCMCQSELP